MAKTNRRRTEWYVLRRRKVRIDERDKKTGVPMGCPRDAHTMSRNVNYIYSKSNKTDLRRPVGNAKNRGGAAGRKGRISERLLGECRLLC